MILLPHLFERVVTTAFYPEGMIRLNVLDEKDFEEVPVLRQVLCLCRFIHDENGRLKLTPKGNLPLKVVKEMYEAGIRDWYFEEYPRQRIQEDEARFVRIARDLATKAGIVRKRNNALVMTRKGEELLLDKQALLETLIRVYVHLFNADDYDGFETIPGLGFRDAGLSILVFDKVRKGMPGETPTDWDYVRAYFNARPDAYTGESSANGYMFRTYQTFMELFGMVTTDSYWDKEKMERFLSINPTSLYDRMIFIDEEVDLIRVESSDGLKIFQLKIALKGVVPPIWRKIQVPSSLLVSNLHTVLQHAMGWENMHLHEFEVNGVLYSDQGNEELATVSYDGMRVADLLKGKGDRIIYRYDFGDYWEHFIEVEEVLEPDKGVDYPLFLDGQRNCPPEDCGGAPGYLEMLKVLSDPEDPEREEYLLWLGKPFDPEAYEIPRDALRFRLK